MSAKKTACKPASRFFVGVDDGARTHDTRNHNPMLYQLNYIHHLGLQMYGFIPILQNNFCIFVNTSNQYSLYGKT